ncbi:MAG: hypothetical protein QY318_03930 [Candidatus Dojkabacteria bacterium]|nr:MAG: hypothetical protein QY318_03930 [Candidatus Dojkabacteria bacterium]
MVKKSRYYKNAEGGEIISLVDPFNEIVKDGEVDSSGVRLNQGGKLMQLNYGQIVLIKKLKLREFLINHHDEECIAVTMIGNNLRITYDQQWGTSQYATVAQQEWGRAAANKKVASIGSYYSPEALVEYAHASNVRNIFFMGFEPTSCWDYVSDVSEVAKDKELKVGVITHGYFSEMVCREMTTQLSYIVYQLDSLQSFFMKKHLKANLEIITSNIERSFKSIAHLELSTYFIPGENDTMHDIKLFIKVIKSLDKKVSWQLRRFLPEYRVLDKPVTSDEKLRQICEAARAEGIDVKVV